jgi:cytochrome c oxidase assembly factor CtaG
LYLFLATLPCDILSGFLVFCDRVVYPVYFTSPRLFGFSALQDQQYAGALMWTVVTVVYMIAGAMFTVRLLLPDVATALASTSDQSGDIVSQTARKGMEAV